MMDRLTLTRDEIAFMAANTPDKTIFTLKLGKFQWKAHAEILTKGSRHFDVLCNGPFRESQDRVVELFDDNPFDFARLLQFLYTGRYDGDLSDDNYVDDKTLEVFFPRDGFSPEELTAEKDRDQFDIHRAMSLLADKYEVPDLPEHIAMKLLRELQEWPSFDADFMEVFVSVFRIVDRYLHELPEINERLVDALYNRTISNMSLRDQSNHSLLCGDRKLPFLGVEAEGRENEEALRNFHQQLQEFMRGNGSFGLEMVLGSHRILNKSFEYFKWSGLRLRSCLQDRHRRL